jgi:hypothetical protein
MGWKGVPGDPAGIDGAIMRIAGKGPLALDRDSEGKQCKI